MAEASPVAFSPQEFREFRISSIDEVTPDVKRFTLDLPSPNHVMGMKTASCLVIRGKEQGGETVVRPYTPTTTNDKKGSFELVIKVYPEGKISSFMHSRVVGQSIEVKGPFPKLEYTPNMKKNIGMVAGGSGITPMLQVLQEVAKNPEDKTMVTMIFANKSPKDIILKKELDKLEADHDNVKIVYLVGNDPEEKWKGPTGRVTRDMVKEHLPAPSEDGLIFVCGPPGMMKAVSGPKNKDKTQGEIGGILKDLGYTADMVYKF